jgi:hypothetical protein
MTGTEIREALSEVRDAVDVPTPDRVAFQRRVRAERRRRTAGRAALAGVVAAAVATVGVVSTGIGGGGERRLDQTPADRASASGRLDRTAFFVRDGRLAALDPAGQVHDLGVAAEGVIGSAGDQVYAVDRQSRVVVRSVSVDDRGRATFAPVDSPISGPVQTASLSGDGRYLGWTDLDNVSHRYDLQVGQEDLAVPGNRRTSSNAVGADGLLLFTPSGLEVRDGGSSVSVPVSRDWVGASSQLAAGHVLVDDRDGRSRLYDVRSGTADLVETLDGFGVLGPDAERVAVLGPASADAPRVEVWDGGGLAPVTGLEGTPDQVRWADEDTLLVTTHDADGAGLWACDLDLACARLPVDGEISLNP